MTECIAIEFRPGGDVLPAILGLFDEQGFALHGLRLVPARTCDRATLHVDVGMRPSRAEFASLGDRLEAIDEVIEVIHCARGLA